MKNFNKIVIIVSLVMAISFAYAQKSDAPVPQSKSFQHIIYQSVILSGGAS